MQRHNVYLSFGEIKCVADLAEMQLIRKSDQRFTLLLCIIGIYSNFVWTARLKDKEGVTVPDALQKIIDKSNRKPNKIWVDQGNKLYNKSFNSWLVDNDGELYSTLNEGKSVVNERLIRTLKYMIYRYMTMISKNVYLNKLDHIVDKYIIKFFNSLTTKSQWLKIVFWNFGGFEDVTYY